MMKTLLLSIALLLLSVSAFAQQNSNTYMPLVGSAQFTNRVQYITVQEAAVVLTEAQTGTYTAACHTKRAAFAAQLVQQPASFASVFAVNLVSNINITTGGALTGSGQTLDTPATDAAILAAVASLWSTVSGCITNP
jgi:hypothetical protein